MEARQDVSALVAALNNPALSRNELLTAVAVMSESRAKVARGEIEADGRVALSTAEDRRRLATNRQLVSGRWRSTRTTGAARV